MVVSVMALPARAAGDASTAPSEVDVTVRVRAVDAFFGIPLEGTLVVTSPQGTERRYSLGEGSALVTADPSGQSYRAMFDGPGIGRAQEFNPTQGTDETLRVVTYLDIGVLALINAAAAAAFLARRKRIRNRRALSIERVFHPGTAREILEPASELRSFVRVRLHTRRVVEGWVDPPPQGEGQEDVLRLIPVSAFDATGRPVITTPLDSFIPTVKIASIETLDASPLF